MKIAYFAGGYIGNIGNAFIELGCLEALKKCLSKNDELYILNCGDSFDRIFDLGNKVDTFVDMYSIKADVAVFTGMVFCKDFIQEGTIWKQCLDIFYKYNPNCKTVFFGAGVGDTTGVKTVKYLKLFLAFLKDKNCEHIITRDASSYNFFKDKITNVYKGIDMASFLHYIDIPKMCNKKFNIICDEKLVNIVKPMPTDIVLQHADVVNLRKNANYCSTSPLNYLYFLGNACKVYTNRIHGVIPSLVFGVPVKFFSKISSDRHAVLNEFPTENKDGFLILDMPTLLKRQKEQLEIMTDFLRNK